MHEPSFKALGMLCPHSHSADDRTANYHWDFYLSAKKIVKLRYLIDDLIHCHADKINKFQFNNCSHAVHGGTDCEADGRRFTQRPIADAIWAELLVQSAGHSKRATIGPDV